MACFHRAIGSKKKGRNKKKNASRPQDPVEEGNGQPTEDQDDNLDEPETPVQVGCPPACPHILVGTVRLF